MIGERISHYKILEKLGSGGMGIVYRALDENLGRDVAVKVLHPEVMHDADRLARFEHEAKSIAKLAHPNILAIHDFGKVGGTAFAVTELLEGETLGHRLAREHLHWRKAVSIAASTAEGLAAAHAKGITHRDIKPENIFLTSDGRVKILDFGIAKTSLPPILDSLVPTLTVPHVRDETVMGTVAYMAPEQLRGEAVDARSDIFTLGCVLYEMLTAQRAFSRGSFALTVTAILMAPAPEVHVSGMEATQELNRIIGRCLEKNPAERFQSASDLAFALSSLLVEKQGARAPAIPVAGPISADTRKKRQDDRPGVRGMKSKWLSRIVVPAALLCILAAAVWLWISGNREITLQVLPSDNEAFDNSDLEASLAQKLNQKISELEIINVFPLRERQTLSGMGQDYVGIAKRYNASALLKWGYNLTGEDLEIYVELIDGRTGLARHVKTFAGKTYQATDPITQIASYVVEKLRPRLGRTEKDKLECLRLYGKGQDELANRSPDSLKKAIQYFEEALKKNPHFARAYVGLADCYNMLGIYGADNPARLFQEGKKAADEALKIDNLLAEAHTSRGFAIERHDFARQSAQREYNDAVNLSSSNRDARASAYHRWGVLLIDLGQYEEAIEKIKQAQKEDPSSQIMQSDLSRAYLYKGDLKEAIRISTETIGRFPHFAPAYRYRGLAYEQARQFQRAIADLEEAISLSQNSPLMKGDLGHVYASAGIKDKALSILSDLQQDRGNGNYRSCFLIAQIYACLGDREEALSHIEQALKEKDPFILSLEVDPILKKALGREPRFRQLAAELARR